MRFDLEIDLLRGFCAVAETRNFTRAAERLGRVQSAVSGQIKRLEDVVGTRLFDRNRRSVKLTPEGALLLGYAHRILRLNDAALAELGQPAMAGRIRLGVTDTSNCYIPGWLARFAAACPRVQLEIRCLRSWEALDALEAGELDLAVVSQPCGRDGGLSVWREPLVWALARGSVVDDEDPLPLAIFAPGCVYRQAALDALDACGRAWRIAYSSPSRDGLRIAVAAGLAVTVAPESTLNATMRRLGPAEGFPALPEIEILLFTAQQASSGPANMLAAVIAGAAKARSAA